MHCYWILDESNPPFQNFDAQDISATIVLLVETFSKHVYLCLYVYTYKDKKDLSMNIFTIILRYLLNIHV